MADSPDHLSSRDLDLLLRILDDGFKGTHRRLDVVNGPLASHASDLDELKPKVATLEERTSKREWQGLGGIASGLGALLAWLGQFFWNRFNG